MNLRDRLFNQEINTKRTIGDIEAIATGGYTVNLITGGVLYLKGEGFNVGDRVLIEDGKIINKLTKLPMATIEI